MTQVYFGFDDQIEMEKLFEIEPLSPQFEILLASYGLPSYEGYAFVLFRDRTNGQLYEVNAAHCSCTGLQEQWVPEATSIEALRYRHENGEVLSEWGEHRPEAFLALEEILG